MTLGADPYCIVKCGGKKATTHCVRNTLEPKFDSRVSFYVTDRTTDVVIQVCCVHICVCVCVCMCVCICVCVHMCACTCMCVFVCGYMHTHIIYLTDIMGYIHHYRCGILMYWLTVSWVR